MFLFNSEQFKEFRDELNTLESPGLPSLCTHNLEDNLPVIRKKTAQGNTVQGSQELLMIRLRDIYQYEHLLWDMNNTKKCNGFYIQFRQSFIKETFSYDEHLKS